MNDKLRNIGNLFRDTRTRTIILATGAVLAVAIVAGAIRLVGLSKGPPAVSTQVKEASISNIQSVPGGFGNRPETPQYVGLQEQQNVQQAQLAARTGQSAVPTLVSSSEFGNAGAGTCCQPCGCGGAAANAPPMQSSSLLPGTLVYNSKGQVIGTVGADGKVRDASGNIIGTVGPDGLVRDMNGNVIGAANSPVAGTPVYDAQGRLIGTVGPDGVVRDASGKMIGTVGPDGVVRDMNGNVIGKASTTAPGAPAYDAQGRLAGVVGTDNRAHDFLGKVLGTVDPATKEIKDSTGNTIGKIGNIVPGTPVYDSEGRLIGTVGADGKVRDANGNVIGAVGPDGVVRDLSGKIIGKVGATKPGTPVYDAQGRLIGTVGADGKVRDANGNVIGTVGLDGVLRDANGNPIGSVTPPGTAVQGAGAAGQAPSIAGLPTEGQLSNVSSAVPSVAGLPPNQNEILQQAAQRQEQIISQQQVAQVQQQTQGAMASQASQLFAAWVSPVQSFTQGEAADTNGSGGGAGGTGAGGAGAAGAEPAVKAGSIMFGVLITAINSDEPGPVLATIVEGKFKGGRLLGSLTNQGETVMLTFNTISLPNISKSISINAVAIDENTARTALSSYTNDHYLLRYGSLFASSFISGYGQAFQTSGQTVINNGLQSQTVTPDISPKGKFAVALGTTGTQFSQKLGNVFNTPPTVYVNSGTALGILFLADVPPLPTS